MPSGPKPISDFVDGSPPQAADDYCFERAGVTYRIPFAALQAAIASVPSVTVAGPIFSDPPEDPAEPMIIPGPIGPAGGSSSLFSTVLDFSDLDFNKRFSIANGLVTANSKIIGQIIRPVVADADDLGFRCDAEVVSRGVGTFDLRATVTGPNGDDITQVFNPTIINYEQPNDFFSEAPLFTGEDAIAEIFQASKSGKFVGFEMYIRSPNPIVLVASFYTAIADGLGNFIPDILLGTGYRVRISPNRKRIRTTFLSPISIIAGNKYAIALELLSGAPADFFFWFNGIPNGLGGALSIASRSSGIWFGSTANALVFYLFSTLAPETPEFHYTVGV